LRQTPGKYNFTQNAKVAGFWYSNHKTHGSANQPNYEARQNQPKAQRSAGNMNNS